MPGISKCFDVNMLDEIPNRSNEEVDSVLGQKEKCVLYMYICLAAEENRGHFMLNGAVCCGLQPIFICTKISLHTTLEKQN